MEGFARRCTSVRDIAFLFLGFKSSASAIPPPEQWHYKLNESKQLVQYWSWTSEVS
jgi:hypothetical protein